MSDIDPGEVRKLESKAPNAVRFFRSLINPRSEEHVEAQRHIREFVRVESALKSALCGRMPPQAVAMALAETCEPAFRRGVDSCTRDPRADDAVREFVKKWFAEKGVVFEYKETENETDGTEDESE